jgi:hypothetical protein
MVYRALSISRGRSLLLGAEVNKCVLNVGAPPSSLRFLERQGGMTAPLTVPALSFQSAEQRGGAPTVSISLSLVGKGQREQRFLLHFVGLG